MNTISISKIQLTDFRCFSSETFKFPTSVGLKHLGGENLAEPRLGANGAGKSSLWEAVCWCLYGSGIKGARTSSLISWGKEQTAVELEVATGKGIFKIKRFGPPTKIEIDGKPKEQKDVDEIVGLSKGRFLNSIIFGQGVPLFSDLAVTERGELFDEVLNLGLWTRCTEAAGNQHRTLELELATKKTELSYIDGKLNGLQTEDDIKREILHWDNEKIERLNNIESQKNIFEAERISELSRLASETQEFITQQAFVITDLTTQRDNWIKEQQEICEKKVSEVELLETELAILHEEEKQLLSQNLDSEASKIKSKLQSAEARFQQAGGKVLMLTHDIEVFDEAEKLWKQNSCPTCEQPISDEKREEKEVFFTVKRRKLQELIDDVKKQRIEFDAEVKLLTPQFEEKLKALNIFDTQHTNLKFQIRSKQGQLTKLEKEAEAIINQIKFQSDPYTKQIQSKQSEKNPYIQQSIILERKENPYERQLERESATINPYISKLDKVKQDREKFEEEKKALEAICAQFNKTITAADYWKQGFKRIRLFFVQQILLALEVEVQSAINSLGLTGWIIKLSTETETKSGTMKMGIQITIKSPKGVEATWEAWSGGEAQRLRLAIGMGLASLIQRAAGVWFTTEVWDEPTNWLGAEGIEDLLEILRYRAESQNKQVWIIDHRAPTYSGFREIWTVVKEASGSKINLLSESEA